MVCHFFHGSVASPIPTKTLSAQTAHVFSVVMVLAGTLQVLPGGSKGICVCILCIMHTRNLSRCTAKRVCQQNNEI